MEILRGAFLPKVAGNMTGIYRACNDAVNYAVFIRCKDYDETPEEAFGFFGIRGDAGATFERGQQLFNSFGTSALVSVNRNTLFDFMGSPKTDFEIAVFCAFCGLRSIIGTKPYAKSNNGLLMARMFGYTTAKEFEVLDNKPTYFSLYFSTKQKVRYQLTEKIIKGELSLYWGLKYYSSQFKGFYVSFTMEFEALVLHAERIRKSTILKQQKEEQRRVVERVKKQVMGK
ncbi:MAG TPA: hypothetical protein DCR35_15380 [Runella sp.]|nr:hypothetical protein [Runella sp.]